MCHWQQTYTENVVCGRVLGPQTVRYWSRMSCGGYAFTDVYRNSTLSWHLRAFKIVFIEVCFCEEWCVKQREKKMIFPSTPEGTLVCVWYPEDTYPTKPALSGEVVEMPVFSDELFGCELPWQNSLSLNIQSVSLQPTACRRSRRITQSCWSLSGTQPCRCWNRQCWPRSVPWSIFC